MGESKVSMKLLVDTRRKRVLFAEAGKDCVDFLFYILSLPVSTIINLIGKKGMVGSLSNLYESIETLNASYIQPNVPKATLLEPAAPLPGFSVPLLATPRAEKKFYKCSGCPYRCRHCDCDNCYSYSGIGNCAYISDDSRAVCPASGTPMSTQLSYVAPPVVKQVSGESEGGFVKGVVTYMVMDDLVVKPMSTISTITLLNKFNVKDVGALEERVVTFGMDKGLKLLRASLKSNKVLTDDFINGLN